MRPVELQNLFAKTQAVERITEAQKAQPENAQRHAIQDGERQTVAKKRKPNPTPRGDEVILHRDQTNEQRDDKKKRRTKGQNQDDDATPNDRRGEQPMDDAGDRVDSSSKDDPAHTKLDITI